MQYFHDITSYAELKNQYRNLALANHPDIGGEKEVMQAINNEFDYLQKIWQSHDANIEADSNEANETAESIRSEFYTQNGWKGDNYDHRLSLKEIAGKIREYVKEKYNDYRFSVTTSYGSMCQELHVSLTEAPKEIYKPRSAWSEQEENDFRRKVHCNQWTEDDEKKYAETAVYSDEVQSVLNDVDSYVQSYNRDDSDSMIDYHDVFFYYSGVSIGKWDKPLKIVPRERTAPDLRVYETVTVTERKSRKVMKPFPVSRPGTIEEGMHFQILSSGFNYGVCKGFVYQINKVSENNIHAYKMDRKLKSLCTGDVRGNNFNSTPQSMIKFLDGKAIRFVELREVTEEYEYERKVKKLVQPEKSFPLGTQSDGAGYKGRIPNDFTVASDTDTRDGSALWVVKFGHHMEREEYLNVRSVLQGIKGGYSKFKKGFIFRYDPTEALGKLAGAAPAETPGKTREELEKAQQLANEIIDKSTDIILDLRLAPGAFIFDRRYKEAFQSYLDSKRHEISDDIIQMISIKALKELVMDYMKQSVNEG